MGERMADGSRAGRDEALFDVLRILRDDAYRFTTVSPATHARVIGRAPGALAADLRDVFGWSRPFDAAILRARLMSSMTEAGIVATDEAGRLRSRVRVSSLGEDLFAHSAYPTREADAVFFGPDTYRFAAAVGRWLTPERAERVRRAVDIGAGAGPGGIVIARAAPAAAVAMVDINDEALRLAAVNARCAGAGNARAVRSDLLTGLGGEFDLIVSNPPYLNDPLKRAYRHGGGEFGAALSLAILDTALARLAPGGTLILYTGVAIVKGTDVFEQLVRERTGGLDVACNYQEIDPDVFGEELETPAYETADRIAVVVLEVTRRT